MDAGHRPRSWDILKTLERDKVSISDLLVTLLMYPPAKHPLPFLLADVTNNCRPILNALHSNSRCKTTTLDWGHEIMCKQYSDSIGRLAHTEPSWHFNATHAEPAQIRDFQLDGLARTVQQNYSDIWSLFFRMATGFSDTDQVSDEQARQGVEEDGEEAPSRSSPLTSDELNERRNKVRHARVIVSTKRSS